MNHSRKTPIANDSAADTAPRAQAPMLPGRRTLLGAASLGALGLTGLTSLPAFADPAGLWKRVQARNELLVGLEGTYPPFNYVDKHGELTGFEVEFAKALAAQMGLSAKFVPTPWSGMLAGLDSGRFDVVINQVTITPDREKKYLFSQPYTVSGAQILVRKGDQTRYASIASLTGRLVGVGLGTDYEAWLKKNAPKVRIQTYSGINTALQDLEIGRVDAIINDRLESAYLLKHTDGRVVAAGQPFSKQYSGIAMRLGHPQLQAHVDAALQALRKDGKLAAISDKWFGMDISR